MMLVFISIPVMAEMQTKATPLPSSFFFGEKDSSPKDENQVYEGAFKNTPESSGVSEEAHDSQGRWVDQDISPLFPELQIIDELSTKNSLKHMKAARRFYSMSKRSIKKALASSEAESSKFNLKGVRHDWEKVDMEENLKRSRRRIEARGRMEAISYLIKGIREMDAVRNPTILKSASYISLKASMYRNYVKQQFLNRNLNICIEILHHYMDLKPEHKQEPEVHRLLAASYRSQEVLSERARDNKARFVFKKNKNKHLLSYALLAYGKDSHQYKFIKKKVDRDMLDVPLE